MAELEATLSERRFQIRMLSQVYGYVRMPQAFADMGWTWALSGNPGMAISGLKRALTLSENIPGARAALAAVYLAQDRDVESEAVYREMLERNPAQPRALIGMARIAALRRQFGVAAEYITAAEAAGVPRGRIMFERAILALLDGDAAGARAGLETLVELQPGATRAWVLLAHMALEADDATRLERIVRQITPFATRDHTVAFVLGEIAQATGDGVNARRHFEQALALRPGNTTILELLLHRDLAEARHDLAENHVRKLLTIDPDHAFGNYVLGTLNVRKHQFSLAETAFRKSLAMRRTPHALRDLAEVLVERGQLAEAAPFARDAVALAPESYQTWGTLGHILMRLRHLPDATDALEKTLTLRNNDVRAGIDLAEVLMLQGDTDTALARIAEWLEPDSPATLTQRDRLTTLQRTIRQSGPTP
jgi:Tfp pilus assembly protein PilF